MTYSPLFFVTDLASAEAQAPEAEAKTLKKSQTIKANSATMKVSKTGTADRIYSSITSKARTYQYIDAETDTIYYALCDFKNTGKSPIDVRHIYAAFIIDGDLNYTASVEGVKNKASSFIHDVSPKSSISCYVYAEIPADVIKNAKSIVMKLGFTDDFSYRVVESGGLPQFRYADQVFEVKIK